jgi:hypothetical protein
VSGDLEYGVGICRELCTISSYFFSFYLIIITSSYLLYLISATLPSVLPIVPFHTVAHPLFHSYHSFITLPFGALPYTAFLYCLPLLVLPHHCLVYCSPLLRAASLFYS